MTCLKKLNTQGATEQGRQTEREKPSIEGKQRWLGPLLEREEKVSKSPRESANVKGRMGITLEGRTPFTKVLFVYSAECGGSPEVTIASIKSFVIHFASLPSFKRTQ